MKHHQSSNTKDGYVASMQVPAFDPDAPRHDTDGSITGMPGRALFKGAKEWDTYCAKKNDRGATMAHGYGASTRYMRKRLLAQSDPRTGEVIRVEKDGSVTRSNPERERLRMAEGRRSVIYLDGRRIDIVQRGGRYYEAGTNDEYVEHTGCWHHVDQPSAVRRKR